MSKKRVEREIRAAHRRSRKALQAGGGDTDCVGLNNQLQTLGLNLKQIPGDGNCLFRALGDQLDGSSGDHLRHRAAVVEYMRQHRQDFEPFVEDDLSFDTHLTGLAENGTFGGNDSIVAFARLHSLSVVIHQLGKPVWQIHGGGEHQLHISYHNGDHYNSVRRLGEAGGGGAARVRLCLSGRGSPAPANSASPGPSTNSADSGQDSDYENSPSNSKLNKLGRFYG